MLNYDIVDNTPLVTGSLFKDNGIVMTGFTNKDIELFIIQNGGNIQKSVNKKTGLLITKIIDSTSSKFKVAKELNINILTKDEFIDKYIN